MITADEAREMLAYDSLTGILTWKKQRSHAKAGSRAGTVKPQKSGKKYVRITICGTKYYAHVIVWLIVHGTFPSNQIDHIDGNGLNNRLENLRLASARDNAMNRRLSARNTSGAIGVHAVGAKWRAFIKMNGKVMSIGRFSTFDEALAARKAAEEKYGFHPNHGTRRPL